MVKLVSKRPTPEVHANTGVEIPGMGQHFDFPEPWAAAIVKGGLADYLSKADQVETKPEPKPTPPAVKAGK